MIVTYGQPIGHIMFTPQIKEIVTWQLKCALLRVYYNCI